MSLLVYEQKEESRAVKNRNGIIESRSAHLEHIIDGGKILADHNDPNAVNSIFSDIDVSAADLYDLFGFPSDDTTGGEKVVIALTFASVPETGVFDTDMLYRIQISPDPRVVGLGDSEHNLKGLLRYFDALKEKFQGNLDL